MSKKVLKRVIIPTVATLLLVAITAVLILFFRVTPSDRIYISKDTDMKPEAINKLLSDAQAKTDSYPDIQYTYDFHVDFNNGDSLYRLGTVNVISFTGRGTENAAGHRINTYTSVKEGTTQKTTSESFYYSEGNVYAKRFGKSYYSEMKESDFLPYTEYSSISVNTDFLNPIFFEKAVVYKCFDGITEIAFTDESEYLHTGIITFIGLDQTDYKYEVYDVVLSATVNDSGMLSEKHLYFCVDYYSESDPDTVLTYKGDLGYKVDKTKDVTVEQRKKSDNYQKITNIQLLSSLTESGYLILANQPGIDVTYKKQVTLKDSAGDEYFYDGTLNIVMVNNGESYLYTSIDTEKHSKEELAHNTAGIFITEGGYTERIYDYVKGELKSSVDNREHDYTRDEIQSIVVEAIGAERLFEDEIASVSVLSENSETITYSVRLVAAANKYFAGYLVDLFSESSENSLDVSSLGFTSGKCDVTITVRKSDGCIVQQVIDYAATLFSVSGGSGGISVEGRCEMTVNATSGNVTPLTLSDYEAELLKNQNK